MRTRFLIFFFLLFTMVCAAQEECELSVNQAPSLLNLRLGMTSSEVNSAFGRALSVRAKPVGERTYFKNKIKKSGSLEGIQTLFLRFFNDRLYQIEFFHSESFVVRDLSAFVNYHSAKSSFPVKFWAINHGYAKATCNGFSLKADSILTPHIEMTDEAVLEKVKADRKEKSELKKKAGN